MSTTEIAALVQSNDLKAVEIALNNGANVNAVDEENRSLLLIAIREELLNMAKVLVSHGADVNQQDGDKDSPFLYAGASGQTELVLLCLENGALFTIFNQYNGTALIPACERGHVETVRLIASIKGYPIDHINKLGWTALLEAVVLGDGSAPYQEIVQILRDAGANTGIPDHDGITALEHAKRKGYSEIVQLLK